MQRDPTLFDPLDAYEALRNAVLYGETPPRCFVCNSYAEAETEFHDPICWDCAREREADYAS